DLWGEDTEASRHRLKSQIAQLRSLLGGELSIEYHQDGYRLRGSLELLDSTLFESLVSGGHELAVDERASRLRRALGLWRADVPFRSVNSLLVDDACRRLAALRTTTVLELADCEIQLHRPKDAVEYLKPIFVDDPTRGDVTSRLAGLLALANRHAEGI